MDPLSITTASLSIVKICITVSWELKKFIDNVESAPSVIRRVVLQEVESFQKTCESLNEVLKDDRTKSIIQSSGHIGAHWMNLKICLDDASVTMETLEDTISKVNKTVTVLDSTRRHVRLQGASNEIQRFQYQIRSYKDTIYVSLQTAILWNQVTDREISHQVMPTLDELQSMIRSLAIVMNQRIALLSQGGVGSIPEAGASNDTLVEQQKTLETTLHLRKCLQSAASVVSSASTIMPNGTVKPSTEYGSNFGDVFPPDQDDSLWHWIESHQAEELSLSENTELTSIVQNGRDQPLSTGREEDWDSDDELDSDMAAALFEQGNIKSSQKNFKDAEIHFQGCISMITEKERILRVKDDMIKMRFDATSGLIAALNNQSKWEETEKLLRERVHFLSRQENIPLGDPISSIVLLAKVLLSSGNFTEALLYGRSAYKSLRKKGSTRAQECEESLVLLVEICQASGKSIEADAYFAMLQNIRQDKGKQSTLHAGKIAMGPILATDLESKSQSSVDLLPRTYHNIPNTLEGHNNAVRAVTFSPDGKLLASGSSDCTVKLWDSGSRRLLRTLEGHSSEVWAVAFSPDGKLLASGSADRTVRLWDYGSRTLLQTLEGHSSKVWAAVAFSPHGKLLASASIDRTIKLWELFDNV